MQPTPPAKLINEIGGYLSTFLHFGRIDSFSSKIDPELNIHNLKRLLRIHFVLKQDVIDFTEKLPERVRRIRTISMPNPETTKGLIAGKVDWQKTIKSWCQKNPVDTTDFVIDRIERNYNIAENLVLKKFLYLLHDIVYGDLKPAIENEYPWVEKWLNGKGLKDIAREVYLNNVYIQRIEPSHRIRVNERMISIAVKSRYSLYRDAAKLLWSYRKIMKYDLNPEEARELLKDTFIHPQKTDVLFQLYWTFKVIQTMTENSKEVHFNIIEENSTHVAEWEDEENIYRIYYDSFGEFSFQELFDERDFKIIKFFSDGFLNREAEVLMRYREIIGKAFGKDPISGHWTGKPDIMVVKVKKEEMEIDQVIIGKVKYTNSVDQALHGLRDLMENMAMITKEENYYQNNLSEVFNSDKVKGWLFVDRMNIGRIDSGNISIIPVGEEIPC